MSEMELRFFDDGTVDGPREPEDMKFPGMESYTVVSEFDAQVSKVVTELENDTTEDGSGVDFQTLIMDFGEQVVEEAIEIEERKMEEV